MCLDVFKPFLAISLKDVHFVNVIPEPFELFHLQKFNTIKHYMRTVFHYSRTFFVR